MDNQELKSSVTPEEQRSFIKLSYLLGKSATQIDTELSQALGKRAYKLPTIQRWLQHFKEGRYETKDLPKSGRLPSARTEEQINRVKGLLDNNKLQSIRQLSLESGISYSTVERILKEDLQLTKKASIWVPHTLTQEQKEMRSHLSQVNLIEFRRHPRLLKKLIAIDESWMYFYHPPSRLQAQFWGSKEDSPPKLPKPELHERKLLLIIGMDLNGVAFWDFLEENHTMDSETYRSFLDKQVTKWKTAMDISQPIILHDNAKPHKSKIVQQLLDEKGWGLLPHPPYSPDMNPCDFNCFGHLKEKLRGIHHNDAISLKNNVNKVIKELNYKGTFNGISKLPEIWKHVIANDGDY